MAFSGKLQATASLCRSHDSVGQTPEKISDGPGTAEYGHNSTAYHEAEETPR